MPRAVYAAVIVACSRTNKLDVRPNFKFVGRNLVYKGMLIWKEMATVAFFVPQDN